MKIVFGIRCFGIFTRFTFLHMYCSSMCFVSVNVCVCICVYYDYFLQIICFFRWASYLFVNVVVVVAVAANYINSQAFCI